VYDEACCWAAGACCEKWEDHSSWGNCATQVVTPATCSPTP
jgi:hypothetical protein